MSLTKCHVNLNSTRPLFADLTLIVDVTDEMPCKIELYLTSFCCRPDKEPRLKYGMLKLIVDVPDEMPRKIDLYLTSFCRPDKEPRLGHVYANCGRP